ncbi:MAG: rhodanese-like domain-containing protein [Saprospiraceae bacterium]|nr:MBL fold metallo-hydrolase [Saprospiraceae bacterium]MCB9314386.1 MBL fold metallo-hydrolase [Lewinellaceae bacterium]HRW74849.1 rhodanese-like domain-containing protein [Saprospiraceae bacterium]
MKIEQIYTGCLAQGAYYIESAGEAAIIDPLRETAPYLERAHQDNATIKYIFETHFHADFVSGHIDLARKSGATIVYGPTAKTDFEKHEATDGEKFQIGKVTIEVLHTPGHTPESTCYLLRDEDGKPNALFSGDTLFIGDVGRPDLAQKATGLTQDDLAGWLFDSLRNKVMTLPDDVIVYPAHGAGSACGKNMSSETWDTLGNQKRTNYALRADMTKQEFITEVTTGLMAPPQYFAKNAAMNKKGYESIDVVMERGAHPLDPNAFEEVANSTGALILDVRDNDVFVEGFIPNAIFIGIDGGFAPWVGALIPDLKQEILIVAPEGREEETVMRLARVGYDNAIGYLKGGFPAWKAAGKEVDMVTSIDTAEFAKRYLAGEASKVLDVRKPGEFAGEHVDKAKSLPLDFLNLQMEEIARDQEYYLHCRTGYRSTIAASILKARGFDKLINVIGSIDDFAAAGIPLTDYVCPSTLAKEKA